MKKISKKKRMHLINNVRNMSVPTTGPASPTFIRSKEHAEDMFGPGEPMLMSIIQTKTHGNVSFDALRMCPTVFPIIIPASEKMNRWATLLKTPIRH